MAETLVNKIVANAGKNWSRNTVADGNWLNANTIVKLNQNDKTLAEAIDSLSASMPHILPEYPGFKLNLESNETIKSIEQKTTGELVVEKQDIDIKSSTLNDKLWAHLQTNKGCPVNNQYTQLYDEGEDPPDLNYLEPGNQGDGCTTSSLILKPGIYSIYLELAYKPGNITERIEKELSVRLCKGIDPIDPIANAEFIFHCNDTYTEINQHRLINAVVKFETEGTLVIQGKTESGHAGGTLQIVNLYIVSVGGATGPKGDKGDKGDPGTPGSPGEKGDKTYLRIRQSDAKWEYSYDQTNWQLMENSPAASGTKGNDGDDGYSPTVTFNEISEGTRTGTEVKITDKDHQSGITYSAWNGMDGVNGVSGTSVSARVVEDHVNKKSTVTLFDPYSSPEHIIQSFEVKDGADGTGAGKVTNIYGINGIEATDVNGDQSVFNIGISADYATSGGLAENKQYAMTTNGWNEIDIPTVGGDYLPLSGGTVSGSTYFSAANGQNMLAVASAASLIGASRQSEANFGQNNDAMGTTWMGVGGPGMYRGFLKYTQGGNVGALDSNNTMQVEFTPSNKGQLFAKAKNNGANCPETQILNPTKASCDAMVQSANANLVSGPNYMLAKNADGQFVIGAALVNCTDINNVTLAPNTYYFVYEV